jgi:hypothetical protein
MGRKKKQRNLSEMGVVKLLGKVDDAIGEIVQVPGTVWNWGDDEAECANQDYACTVTSYTSLHRFTNGTPPGRAFQLEDPDRTDSGEARLFWIAYPIPFMEYWYKGRAALGEQRDSGVHGEDEHATPEPSDGDDDAGSHAGGRDRALCRTRGVYKHLEKVSEDKIVGGKSSGKTKVVYKCAVQMNDGHQCGTTVSVVDSSTSNAITHFRRRARDQCPFHAAALARIEEDNCKSILLNGKVVPVYNFRENFEHHCDFVYMVADGVAQSICKRQTFKDFVHGFEPRATMPHHVTIHRIATVINELQEEDQEKELHAFIESFQGLMCVGLQIDLWTDGDTHVCYAGMNLTRVLHASSDEIPARVQSEVLEFEQFPHTSHTGANIADWIVSVLARKKIKYESISGITPDGAADGKAAIRLIPGLKPKLDVCFLHQLNRTILVGIGLAKKPCRNTSYRALVKVHRRIVALHNQTRYVSDAVRKVQLKAKVPEHKLLTPTRTCPTRWGNMFDQVQQNITLRPVIDPVVSRFKIDKGADAAIVEDVGSESDDDSGVRKRDVPCSELGISETNWQQSIEMESFLKFPNSTARTVEMNLNVTGAQALQMMVVWYDASHKKSGLPLLDFPKTAKLRHRIRKSLGVRKHDKLSVGTQDAIREVATEMCERFFPVGDGQPSVTRLIQIYMSKQMPAEDVLAAPVLAQAKTAYTNALRDATKVVKPRGGEAAPHAKNCDKRKRATSETVCFFSPGAEEEVDAVEDATTDSVALEIEIWNGLPASLIRRHTCPLTSLLDEFALISEIRLKVPLHYIVFREVCSHICHEGNSEQLFSLAKLLADPNTHPSFLRILTKICSNKKIYKPSAQRIWDRYQDKYKGARCYFGSESDESAHGSQSESDDDSE